VKVQHWHVPLYIRHTDEYLKEHAKRNPSLTWLKESPPLEHESVYVRTGSQREAIQLAIHATFLEVPTAVAVTLNGRVDHRKRGRGCHEKVHDHADTKLWEVRRRPHETDKYIPSEDGFYYRDAPPAVIEKEERIVTKKEERPMPEPKKDFTEQISGVKCQGCGKAKTIATHSNKLKQPFCGACNMRLIRAFGSDYGVTLDNPATSLRGLIERKEAKRDIKAVRKIKYTLLNLMDDCDLDDAKKARVLAEFSDVFSGLEESFSHFAANA
jgi:hypothetical protein